MLKKLVLASGDTFYGKGFGANKDCLAEIVFNTSMVGYQEIMSDASYNGQMVVMTYPLIGNYGVTDEDNETKIPHISGFIVREYNDRPSNFRYTKTFAETLEEAQITGITGVDTRALTRIIRSLGSQKAIICDADLSQEEALRRIAAYETPSDLVAEVSCKKRWYSRTANPKYNVVAIDCGIKLNIVRKLNVIGCNVTIVPYDTTPAAILQMKPDGVFLSNGPGNPQDVKPVIAAIQELQGKLPIFGICLGHQMIALANGAKTFKMKFGHRGGNHPVQNTATGHIEITSQNHSYAVDLTSLQNTCLSSTHINLLDQTCEGIACPAQFIFSVQYHPESAPGPEDSTYLFDQFQAMMEAFRQGGNNNA